MHDIITYMKSLYVKLSRLKRAILNLIFPHQAKIRKIEEMPIHEMTNLNRALLSPQNFIFPIFSYKNQTVRNIVHQIKFKGNKIIASKIGLILAEEIQAYILESSQFESAKKYILAPIPLSKQRLRERGFNQAQLLAKNIADNLPDIFCREDVLIRHVNTNPQTKTQNRKERLENIKGCFSVKNAEEIKKHHVILIDDVTTTGATLAEARKTLKRSGIKNVIAFTVAH